jgi:DNA helicase-2/ATP-dependent DNA helicase PcrA
LKDLIEFLKIDGINSHNALDDVKATVSLIEKLNTDYTIHFKDAQSQFLQDADNITVFKRLIKNFHPIFTEIQTTINTYGQLRSIVDRYFEFTKIEKEEKQEVEKLTEHLNFYTNIDYRLTLKEKIHKYIPEYLLYKESDLYRDEQIVVSTVYKAKGLEFDNVVIADATDEMYPRLWNVEKSLRTEKTLEDARAFYVAMTRAKKKLYITIPTINQRGYNQTPSRFISCIQNYFDWIVESAE